MRHLAGTPGICDIGTIAIRDCGRRVIELRDRALIAFTLLTGARDRAIASMKLKHVDQSRTASIKMHGKGPKSSRPPAKVKLFWASLFIELIDPVAEGRFSQHALRDRSDP